MSKFPIHFFSDGVKYNLQNKAALKEWLLEVVDAENGSAEMLSYIFCGDSRISEISLKYLKTNALTDVVAFDLSDYDSMEGEIYISIERVVENALRFNNTEPEELHRVMVHGLLHLLGYKDKSKRQKAEMTGKEDLYLSLLSEKI